MLNNEGMAVKEMTFKAPKNYYDLASLASMLVIEDINFTFDFSEAKIVTKQLESKWLASALVASELRDIQYEFEGKEYNYLGECLNE